MGLALALGLVLGKTASFIASFTTVPLALYTPLSYRTPFIVSTALTFFSVLLNIVFVRAFSRNSNSSAISNAEAHIRAHKTVAMKDIYSMSGLFWFYLLVCLLAGAVWTPFVQLSTTIVKHRFAMQDVDAADYASIILFLPIFLYPAVGWFTDRYGRRLSLCNSPFRFYLCSTVVLRADFDMLCFTIVSNNNFTDAAIFDYLLRFWFWSCSTSARYHCSIFNGTRFHSTWSS
jgi:nitrate/nitrite transporter NarK